MNQLIGHKNMKVQIDQRCRRRIRPKGPMSSEEAPVSKQGQNAPTDLAALAGIMATKTLRHGQIPESRETLH